MAKEKNNNHVGSSLEVRAKEAKIVRKFVMIIIIFLLVVFITTTVLAFSYVTSALKPVDENSDEKVEVEIPLGSSTTEIANILEENGIIKDSKIFRIYVKFKNFTDFQAGEYVLSPSLTLKEIITELQSGKIIEEPIYTVTIPEGKVLQEIVEILSHKLSLDEEAFMKKVQDESFIQELINTYPSLLTEEILEEGIYEPLEGYLFAGTYEIFEEDPTIESVIHLLVERTNSIMETKVDLIEESEFSVHEILTLASVIERESKFSEDRPKVSQVYMNRLNENMRLQSDITAFYGIQHKAVVTYEDVKVDTPYNTYVIDGLPIGPINSPSEESIDAVLEPEGEEFNKLYYFSRPSGETFYADTLEEHNVIKEKYRHEWYELENEDGKDES